MKKRSRAGGRPGQREGEATNPGSVSDTGAKLSSKARRKHHANPEKDFYTYVRPEKTICNLGYVPFMQVHIYSTHSVN